MAWQLIYTSAPRLLEAGRTGFGTVARHRAVSGMLASTVERFSQFARLPGHDPRRVVHTYRLLTVAGSTYHVFSCLKDAGSDYTGRTNHLAQHVIAEAREIRALTASGLTPADVLLAMPWRSSWTESPRFLDPGEEIDLAGFWPAASNAWASVTGNPAYARLLCIPQALKGCYVIPPPAVDVLELFREAMLEAPQAGWQTSFTTSLEPNDEVGDFRWIGLPSGSPLRSQAEVSNRPLLDLTQPAKLPAPPEPPAKPAPPPPDPEVAAPFNMEPGGQIRSPGKVTLGRPPMQSTPTPLATMGGWSPEPLQPASKKRRKGPLLALMAAALLIASVAGFLLWQHVTETKERAAFQNQIKQVWDRHGLALVETRKRISDEQNLETGRALLGSIQAYVEGVQEVLKNSGSKAEPPQPEDTSNMPGFDDLQESFKKWTAIENDTKEIKGSTISELSSKYGEWRRERERCWRTLADHLKKIGTIPDVDPAVLGKIVESAKKLLRTTEPDTADMSMWEQLNKLLGNDLTIAEWLSIWSGLDGSDKLKLAASANKNESLPPWLTKKAQKVQDESKPTQPTEKPMIAVKPTATIKPKIQDADTLDGKHSIYICLLKKGGTSIVINEPDGLPLEKEMHIYVGGAWDKHTIPDGTSAPQTGDLQRYEKYEAKYFKNSYKTKEQNLGFGETGKDINLSADLLNSGKGCRIVARRKDDNRVLFDVRILPEASLASKPVLAPSVQVKLVNKDKALLLQGLVPILARFRWADTATPYRLRLDGTQSEQKEFELDFTKDELIVKPPKDITQPQRPVSGPPENIDSQIRGKQQEVNILKGKVKRKEKGADADLKKADGELKELEGKKSQGQSNQATPQPESAPVPLSLPPGNYTVLRGSVEVCTFTLMSSRQPPATSIKSAKP